MITGASGLIGSELAIELAKEKANLILHYNKSEDVIEDLISKLSPVTQVHAIKCDFSDLNNVVEFLKYLKNTYRRIDIVVNSVGIYDETPLELLNVELLTKILNINLLSIVLISKELGMLMKEYGGTIINLICLTPLRGHKVYKCLNPSLPYVISKTGLIQLVKYLAVELAPKVKVVGIALGWVGSSKLTQDLVRCVEGSVPMKRVAEAHEVVELIKYLICGSQYITGSIIEFSGGL